MMIRIIVSVAVPVPFGLTLDNHPIVDPPHWNPSWPMYENGTYEKCRIGYGDWCVVDEGPHPDLDFDDPPTIFAKPEDPESCYVVYIVVPRD